MKGEAMALDFCSIGRCSATKESWEYWGESEGEKGSIGTETQVEIVTE